MGTTYLIVRGDDFGLSHGVNQAIEEAFETGLLTCASVLAVGPWIAEAANLIREHPEWEVGLQLALTCTTQGCRWGPAAGAAAVLGLVEPAGTFHPGLPQSVSAAEIDQELDAQVARLRAYQIVPAFLEYHGETHPDIEASLGRLSQQLGIPARTSAWGIQPLVLAKTNRAPLDALREALAALHPGAYLWATSPAQDSPEGWALWGASESSRRHEDLQLLCSSEVRAGIRERGIELISFRQLVEMRVGTAAED